MTDKKYATPTSSLLRRLPSRTYKKRVSEMGDMGDIFNAMKRDDKVRRLKNLKEANLSGFTRHSDYHYSCDLNGSRLDYWPSRNKWRWNGRTYNGDVHGFIQKRVSK